MARARPTKPTNAALQRLAEPFWEKVRGAAIDEYFLERLLRALLRRWRDDRFARVKQGGLQGDSRAELARVFIDLDVGFDDAPRRPDETAEATRVVASWMRLRSAPIRHPRQRMPTPELFGGVSLEVLLGGPGQGKSTVGRFLMLIHGAVLLLTSPIAGITTDADVANMRALLGGIARENIPLPEVLQLPVWIELREMADALLQEDGCDAEPLRALTSWFAATELRERDDAAALEAALGALPWVMIFDGLDEVPPERGRMLVRGCVSSVRRSFAPDDRHIIGTSRPQSYERSVFGEGIVERTLLPLTPERATAYTERFADCLHGEEEGERERLLKRMKGALANPTTAALMQSPLLVTIMAALVLHHGEPTDRRWTLFEDYYKTLYRRETERGTYASKTLREHAQLIDAIHMHVGMSLQVRSESAEGVSALMPEDELRALLHTRLRPKFGEEESAKIAADILRATEQRLVFLVQSRKGMYGFDLRSFQEFMAAWQVVSLREAQVDALLLRLAPLAAWRNVMLFAIGQQYAHNSALAEERSVGLCAKLDEEGDLTAKLVRPGARLAIGVLEDAPYGSATVPRDALVERALSVWDGLEYSQREGLVEALDRVAPQRLPVGSLGDFGAIPSWDGSWTEIKAEIEAASALASEFLRLHQSDAAAQMTVDEIVALLARTDALLSWPFSLGPVPDSLRRGTVLRAIAAGVGPGSLCGFRIGTRWFVRY